jgi:hypothetical protein
MASKTSSMVLTTSCMSLRISLGDAFTSWSSAPLSILKSVLPGVPKPACASFSRFVYCLQFSRETPPSLLLDEPELDDELPPDDELELADEPEDDVAALPFELVEELSFLLPPPQATSRKSSGTASRE